MNLTLPPALFSTLKLYLMEYQLVTTEKTHRGVNYPLYPLPPIFYSFSASSL